MFNFPRTCDPLVAFVIASCLPTSRLVAKKFKHAEEVPSRDGSITRNIDDWVLYHMLRKADFTLKTREQGADLFMAFCSPDTFALPNSIFSEDSQDFFWVVIVVTDFTVTGFDLSDGLYSF